MTTYTLRPQPPIRAFAVAAALSVLGAVLVIVCAAKHAAAIWMWLSVLIVVIGVALVIAGLLSMVRLRTYVDLTDDGYTVRAPNGIRSGKWDDVTKVTITHTGAHLTLYHGQVQRTHILAPGNIANDEMKALADDIAKRMDVNRGYRNIER